MAKKRNNNDTNNGRSSTSEEVVISDNSLDQQITSNNLKTESDKKEQEEKKKAKIEVNQKKLAERQKKIDGSLDPDPEKVKKKEKEKYTLKKEYSKKLESISEVLENTFESVFKIGFWVLFAFMFAFPPASLLFTGLFVAMIGGYFLTSEYWKDEFKDMSKTTVKVDEAKYYSNLDAYADNYIDQKKIIDIRKSRAKEEEEEKLKKDLEEEKKRNSQLKHEIKEESFKAQVLNALANATGNCGFLANQTQDSFVPCM